jgi:transposase-like protein
MTSNALKHQARLQEWTVAIQECRSSGLPVKQWCRNQGITTTTYYRWERELLALTGGTRNKPQLASTTTFAELPAPRQQCRTVSELSATVHINDVAIDIYPRMDTELLKTLLDAVRLC